MIRNFIRQSHPWTMNTSPLLGRWNRNDNIDRKVDLANIDSCSFIATDDLGRRYEDGTFSLHGRFDSSELRGCNLLLEGN